VKLHAEYPALAQALAARGESDPLRLLESLAAAQRLTAAEYRHVRAQALHALLIRLQRAVELCDFQNELSIRPDGAFVDVGGVWMESAYTSLYLKTSGERARNQAENSRSL
jgi:hypothetical protein